MQNLEKLVQELITLPHETSWVEFKHNNYKPEVIGEDISALANSAAYIDRDCAYMVWGVHDETHEIVGTEFDSFTLKKGNQEIENWLRDLLSTNCEFQFVNLQMNNKPIVVLIINRALYQPVTFQKIEYIRVGSYTKKLMDRPAMKAQLWDRLRNNKFELLSARADLTKEIALSKLEYAKYFELKKLQIPAEQDTIIHYMLEEGVLLLQDNGFYSITNLGALLFAKRLAEFSQVARKSIRVIQYEGQNKLKITREKMGAKGYAVEFEGLMAYLDVLLPTQEIILGATRRTETMYPQIALREIIANALIHQDFAVTGAGPVVEIFDNRVEITNPGTPLIDIVRFVDNPPRSRNEKLASLMRTLRMCEELGSGWDRIVISCELENLPAPRIELYEESTKVILYAEKSFANISLDDKLWSCYLHACIKFLEGDALTNASLRARFGLLDKSSAPISRLIKEALIKKLIKPVDPNTAPRHMRYIPYWA